MASTEKKDNIIQDEKRLSAINKSEYSLTDRVLSLLEMLTGLKPLVLEGREVNVENKFKLINMPCK